MKGLAVSCKAFRAAACFREPNGVLCFFWGHHKLMRTSQMNAERNGDHPGGENHIHECPGGI